MKRVKCLILLILALLLAGIVGSVWVLQRPNTNIVEIVQDNEVLARFDLSQEQDRIIVVVYEGRSNRVEIKNHQIHIIEADCPDHTCIHMSWLDSAAPIVCLPNHLVIQFSGQSENIDAAVQ